MAGKCKYCGFVGTQDEIDILEKAILSTKNSVAIETWQTLKTELAELSNNSDYAAALKVLEKWSNENPDLWNNQLVHLSRYIKERLNSEKQNCA